MSRIRIVGGQWRSRLLQVPDAIGLRPTPDRVRETLFNWLGQDLTGWRCLDLFAGSGILGLEAASRGAERVVLVERSRRVLMALRESAESLRASQLELIHGDGVEFAQSASRPFDLVFLDPPYHQGWLARVEPFLANIVKPAGWLYVEAETALTHLGNWQTMKQGRAGQVHFHLLRDNSA